MSILAVWKSLKDLWHLHKGGVDRVSPYWLHFRHLMKIQLVLIMRNWMQL